MSAGGKGALPIPDKEGAQEAEGPGHRHACPKRLSGPEEMLVPLGANGKSPHIKKEPEEPQPGETLQEDRVHGNHSWAPLSQSSEQKAPVLPARALPFPQVPLLARPGRTRDRKMAAALLSAWSQMPVTFEDVALYLSREEWGRLDHTQQSFRDTLQKRTGLSLGLPVRRTLWAKAEASSAHPCATGKAGAPQGGKVEAPSPLEATEDAESLGGAQATMLHSPGPVQDAGPQESLEEDPPEEQRPPRPTPRPTLQEQRGAAQGGEEAPEGAGEAGRKTYRCEQCGKGFSWHSHLVTHRRTHTGEKPYSCTDCGKRFGRSSHLIQHQIIHTGEKPYTCRACWKSFGHHSTLIQHQRIHTGEKPYACERCAKRFTRRSDLVTHTGTHTGAKPHKCPVCAKCFTQSSALVTHQRTHTGVKPYPCPECGKCFSQRSNLIAHNRTHTGEKPYHCLDCGKSFSHSSHLTAHQRTHRGVRPYSCGLCGKSFSRRSNLHRHEKIHAAGPKALAMLVLGAAAAGALANAPQPAPT